MSEALEHLAERVRDQGGLLARSTAEAPAATEADPQYGAEAARGPRAAPEASRYDLLVEAIREGYLLHYATPRVILSGDPDLDLLAGDQLYALGLAELADIGDVEAVSVLADVISASAAAHASGRPQDADAAWARGARSVGWGRETAPQR